MAKKRARTEQKHPHTQPDTVAPLNGFCEFPRAGDDHLFIIRETADTLALLEHANIFLATAERLMTPLIEMTDTNPQAGALAAAVELKLEVAGAMIAHCISNLMRAGRTEDASV